MSTRRSSRSKQTVIEGNMKRAVKKTLQVFSPFIDEKYELDIEYDNEIDGHNHEFYITISLKYNKHPLPTWYKVEDEDEGIEEDAEPSIIGEFVIDSSMKKSPQANIELLKVGYFKKSDLGEHGSYYDDAEKALGGKGVGQFLILIFVYLFELMNGKLIMLDDQADKPGFYERFGFSKSYKEGDEEHTMINDIYSSTRTVKGYNGKLQNILSKKGDENWSWENTRMEIDSPNPHLFQTKTSATKGIAGARKSRKKTKQPRKKSKGVTKKKRKPKKKHLKRNKN